MGERTLCALVVVLVLTACATSSSTPSWNTIERASLASDGTQANAESWYPELSADGGYVVYRSPATNLVSVDESGVTSRVFLHDRSTHETVYIPLAGAGTRVVDSVLVSADGRYVVYSFSGAANLGADAANPVVGHVFVHDRETGETTWASEGLDPLRARPEISSDGRYVAFVAETAGDRSSTRMPLFVYDQQTGERVEIAVAHDLWWGWAISDNGRFVAFSAEDERNLVPGDTNGVTDLFLYDRDTDQVTRVSMSSDSRQAGNGHSGNPALSADGRYVAFDSDADNLVPGDTNRAKDVFVYDRETGETIRVSVTLSGGQRKGDSSLRFLSPDGRSVLFASSTGGSPFGDQEWDLFVHDRDTARTSPLVPRDSPCSPTSTALEDRWVISADLKHIAFSSPVSDLVDGDTNGVRDIFVCSR